MEYRKISDVVDLSCLPDETRFNCETRVRQLIIGGGFEGYCCGGDALVDEYQQNMREWIKDKCILAIVQRFSSVNTYCVDRIGDCPRFKTSFGGLSPGENLRWAFETVRSAGYKVRLSKCMWRNGT